MAIFITLTSNDGDKRRFNLDGISTYGANTVRDTAVLRTVLVFRENLGKEADYTFCRESPADIDALILAAKQENARIVAEANATAAANNLKNNIGELKGITDTIASVFGGSEKAPSKVGSPGPPVRACCTNCRHMGTPASQPPCVECLATKSATNSYPKWE